MRRSVAGARSRGEGPGPRANPGSGRSRAGRSPRATSTPASSATCARPGRQPSDPPEQHPPHHPGDAERLRHDAVGAPFPPGRPGQRHADLTAPPSTAELTIDAGQRVARGLAALALCYARLSNAFAPGGTYAFTQWALDDAPADRLGRDRGAWPLGSGSPAGAAPMRFSDPDECRRALQSAGFRDVGVARIDLQWRTDRAERCST